MKRILQYISIFTLVGLMQNRVQAQITSAGNGSWSATTTWVGGVVPGAGDNVIIAPGHTVTLTAAVDITTGNLTVTGTIALAGFNLTAGSLSGAGNIGSASGTPLVTVGSNGSNTTYSGIFSGTGAQLTKEGTGTLTLSGANTYTGTTTINAGTLQLGAANDRISNSSALIVASGATFDMNGRTETVASIAGAGTVTSSTTGAITLSVGGDNLSTTFSGVIQNGSATSIAITKTGSGALTLTGANTYTGATTISAGTLSIGNGVTSGAIAGNITNSASLIFNHSDNLTYAGIISGTGTLTKQGAGILTLTGVNTYTGATTISGGSISLGDGGTTGSIAGASIVNNAALLVNRSNAYTYSGVISGTGTVIKEGSGVFTISGANAYTGATTINAGTLQLGAANERISNNSALVITSGATFDMNGRTETVASLAGAGTVTSSTTGALTLSVGGDNSSTTFSGIIQNGTATSIALTKTGTGTLTLSGANTYTGTTTISGGGVLSIGDGGTSGSIAGNISNSASLIINRSDDLTYSGVISGTGTLTKQGAGILTLTGANTYTGATTISAGTISIGSGGTTGSIASTSIVNNAAIIFNRSNDLTYAGVISGTGTLTKQGAAILYLSNNNTYTGTTTISTGTLSFGNGGLTGTIAGTNIVNNAALVFNSQNAQTCSGVISGTGTLTYQGTNMLTLSGNNTYSGSTTINGGTLSISGDGRLGNAPTSATPGHLVFNGGQLNATANFTLSANRGITLNAGGGIFAGAAVTYQGIIAGTGGLTVNGGSGLTLSGASANTYSGVTTVNASTLTISADNKLGAVPGSATPGNIVLNGGTLLASATFTLNANRGISLSSGTTNTINVASGTLTYGGVIAGTTNLTKSGAGTLILSGANTYTGATNINAGTLAGAHANALRSSASVTVNINTTLRSDVALMLPPLTLSGTGATAGKMNCNGFNSTAGQLRLNTTWQTAVGSWGSSTSGATNQNNTYFSGASGVLNVSGPMIIEVVTTAPGQTVTLPLSGTVNVLVNWGDATTNTYITDADVDKVYAAAGTYTITISGILTQFGNGDNPDGPGSYANPERITRVLNWGGTGLQSLFGAFRGSTNLVQVPSDFPPNVVNVGWMFKNSNFNQPIGTWNMSNVRRMGHMFENNTAFNQDIGAWDVSNVTDMRFMFLGATSFNNGGSPSIGNWNTANLNRPRGMFINCTSFDQNLGGWNISQFWDVQGMFEGATLSPCNYDATLIGWAAQSPDPIRFNSFHGGNSKYTAAGAAARATLSGAPSNWVITDGGLIVPAGPASSTPTVCLNTTLTPITHTTEGITGIGTPTGLPAGVTASYASNTITISGTPTAGGTFNYSIPLTGFCSSVNATGTITVEDWCFIYNGGPGDGYAVATSTLPFPLPLNLLRFEVQQRNCNAIMEWNTANEVNTSHFEIEASETGSNFRSIGRVQAQGTGSGRSYRFEAAQAGGRMHYRLKMVDFDGSYTYSPVRTLSSNCNQLASLQVYPNPLGRGVPLTVQLSSAYNGPAVAELIGVNGSRVKQVAITVWRGTNNYTLATDDLAPGSYMLRITTQQGERLGEVKHIIRQ